MTPAHEAPENDSETLRRDLEVYGVVAAHFAHDLRIFWEQTSAFVAIDAALITVFVLATPQMQGIGAGVLLAMFGLVITAFWAWTAWVRVKLIDRWRENLKRVDMEVDRFKFFVQLESWLQEKPLLRSPTYTTKFLPWLIALIWVVLLVVFSVVHVDPVLPAH